MPKEMGGTPKQLGRTWGEGRGDKKWRLDRTSTPEGWLGEGRGYHSWRDPRGLEGSGGSEPSIFPAQSGSGKPAGLPGWVLRPLRPPPGHVGPRTMGRREEKIRKRN